MEAGDMIVLSEAYRRVYLPSYHIGIVLWEAETDPYFGSRRWVILWRSGETGTYVESNLADAWEVKIRYDSRDKKDAM